MAESPLLPSPPVTPLSPAGRRLQPPRRSTATERQKTRATPNNTRIGLQICFEQGAAASWERNVSSAESQKTGLCCYVAAGLVASPTCGRTMQALII